MVRKAKTTSMESARPPAGHPHRGSQPHVHPEELEAFVHAPIGKALLDLDGRFLVVNPALCRLLGADEEAIIGKSRLDFTHPDDREIGASELADLVAGIRHNYVAEKRYVRGDGSIVWTEKHVCSVANEHGDPSYLIAQMLDTTERHHLQVLLAGEHARFEAIAAYSIDAVVIADGTGQVSYASPDLTSMLAILPHLDFGKQLYARVHPEDLPVVTTLLSDLVQLAKHEGAMARYACRVRHADETWRHIELTASSHVDDPAIAGIVFNVRDMTDRVQAAVQLEHRAMHDALTGLPNRALLLDRMDQALARRRRSGRSCALLFLDLDRFKAINDTYGHGVGDDVLVATAHRISGVARECDSVARLGGDEFVVLLEDVISAEQVLVLADRIRSSMAEPIEIRGRSITTSCSVGIALATGQTSTELLREADAALYKAKQSGRDRWEIFDQAMREFAARRCEIEERLRSTVALGTVEVHFQPIVMMALRSVVGYEALAQLSSADGTPVTETEFVSVAEDSGLIQRFGSLVMRESCLKVAALNALRPDPLDLAVNVSARQLADPAFVHTVATILDAASIDPRRLCLQMTESALMESESDSSASSNRLLEVKRLGVRLSLDDFGTGWSSLSSLQRFMFDVVKIDPSFVTALGVRSEATALVSSVVGLGTTLGFETIAEGVETESQEEMLRSLGCHLAQGPLYGWSEAA